MSVSYRLKPGHSLDVLRRLKPGQKYRYYRGDFPREIAFAERKDETGVVETPAYGALLRSIRDGARALADEGRIVLLEEPVKVQSPGRDPVQLIDYVAVGL